MRQQNGAGIAGSGIMFLSALIFGAVWYLTSWNYYSVINGQFLFFVALLDWTIKGTTVAFVLAGLLTLAAPFSGNMLYAIAGLLSAICFTVVGVLDILDPQHTAMHPLILFVFAAWNGYGAWSALQELLAERRVVRSQSTQLPNLPG